MYGRPTHGAERQFWEENAICITPPPVVSLYCVPDRLKFGNQFFLFQVGSISTPSSSLAYGREEKHTYAWFLASVPRFGPKASGIFCACLVTIHLRFIQPFDLVYMLTYMDLCYSFPSELNRAK